MSDNVTKVAKSYTLEIQHVDMIVAHGRSKMLNDSAALRDILDKAKAAGLVGGAKE